MNLAEEIIKKVLLHNNPQQIQYEDESISALELANRTSSLTTDFDRYGLWADEKIILIMNDSPEFIYTFLALMALGCVPIPLNPHIKETELDYILGDSRASGIIVDLDRWEAVRASISNAHYLRRNHILVNAEMENTKQVTLSDEVTFLQSPGKSITENRSVSFHQKKPGSIAFWQYTSGTTGTPKAVQHTQQVMLTNTKLFAQEKLGITKRDRIMSIPKMFFGYGLGNSFFFPLLLGASVFLDRRWFSLMSLKENLARFRPTIFFGAPKVYAEVLGQGESFPVVAFNDTRIFFSAGSPIPDVISFLWKARFGSYILNGIGCTEIGHVFLCHDPKVIDPKVAGRPVSCYRIKLVDLKNPDRVIQEPNKQGELCIAPPSNCLSIYWENVEANRSKFNDGWYLSGDVCSFTINGDYVYHGRKDDLFKVNGRWINPLEIETRISSFIPQLECAVVAVEAANCLEVPVLFVAGVASTEHQNMERQINGLLTKEFPRYKCPHKIIFITAIPKNSNGKMDRNTLKRQYTKTVKEMAPKLHDQQEAINEFSR